ncbi:MAG: hemerythrin family protein [Deltaproteobacteria bacterium]|nr:hemerythrin family protein [Deltaproteobacteria bacterium]
MPIEWNNDLCVGVDVIDNQHKELLRRINALLDACSQGKGKDEVGRVIKFLEDYITVHFNAEEAIQKKNGYPDYETHKGLHDEFRKNFSELKKRFENEVVGLYLVLLTNRTVVDWLINHIGRIDKALGSFLKKQGGKG